MSSVEQTDHQKGENSPERNGIQDEDKIQAAFVAITA
jgi:hypothetical protein